MTAASTAFGQLRYIAETTPGTIPVAGNGVSLRTTGPTMKAATQSITSNEIRAQRMASSGTDVDRTVDGGFNFELSAKEYDPFMAAVLCGAWEHFGTGGVGVATQVTTTASTITASSAPVGTSAFTTLKPGQWFKLLPDAGASAAIKSYFAKTWLKVDDTTAPTATEITLSTETPLSGDGLIGVDASMQITSSRVIPALLKPSFTLEWYQSDVGQYLQYIGMRPNTMSLDFAVGAILTGSFEFMGAGHTITQAAALPGTITASQSGSVMNSVTDMGVLAVNGSNLLANGTSFIQKASLSVNNNLRGLKALGVFGNIDVGYGTLEVSGSMDCYFEDENLYDLALSGNYFELAFGTEDNQGNGYVFNLPKARYVNAALNLGDKNSDVMLNLPFQGYLDDGKGYGVAIYRAVAA